MVRVHQDPPQKKNGGLAQLGEHLLCKQGVNGSIPLVSTKHLRVYKNSFKIKNFCERAAFFAVCFLFFKNLEKK
jgi:hypothetical protein